MDDAADRTKRYYKNGKRILQYDTVRFRGGFELFVRMRYSAFYQQPRRPDELVDDGTFQCCQRIGRSYLICGRKSSHFPYTCFVGPDWYCMLVTYALIIVPTVLFIHNVAVLFGAYIIVPTVFLLLTTLGLFSYTACSDPGIAFAPRPAYNSSDEDSNVGISLVNAVQSHVNSVNAGDGERETFDVNSNGSSRSSSSKSDDHHYEPHAEEGMQGDIEDGLNHNNSHSDASLVPQNALNVGTTSGMSNRISISGNRIRVGNNGHTNSGSSHSSTSSSGIGALNHPSGTGGGNGHSSGGSLNGVPLPHPRLPPPALIECGRCQIDRPRDASHCSDCGVCVRKLDHHCPWTGKCIGAKTIYTFFAFLASLGMLMCFVIVVVVVAVARRKDAFSFENA